MRTQKISGAIVLLVVVLTLVGCTYAQAPVPQPSDNTPTPEVKYAGFVSELSVLLNGAGQFEPTGPEQQNFIPTGPKEQTFIPTQEKENNFVSD